MRVTLALLLALTMAAAPGANTIVSLGDQASLPLPGGWQIVGPADAFPLALSDESSGAHLLIFRTDLSPDERIAGAEDFRVSVNRVIDSVVLQLPDAILLTSTGSYDHSRADFVVEFQTVDSVTARPLLHRLAGVLYRHPDGFQLLFSFWAQAPPDVFGGIREDLETMQAGFTYTGPQEEYVFAATGNPVRWAIVLIIGLAAVFFIMRQRRSQLQKLGAATTPVWRCECGRPNHIDNLACRRCGRPRPAPPSGGPLL